MPPRRRTLLTCGLGLLAAIGSARALAPPMSPVPPDEVRRAFDAGGTLVGYLDRRLFVERYEPGGHLRGTYAGRAYEGRWSIERDRLCTAVAPQPPTCVSVHGVTDTRIADGSGLWLFPDGNGPAMGATYRTRAPWRDPSPPMSARVVAGGAARDSFGAVGTVAGLPTSFVVWTGREMRFRSNEAVTIHGTTDGVTFTADRVTRPDGTPVP